MLRYSGYIATVVFLAMVSSSCVKTDIAVTTPDFGELSDGTYVGGFDGGIVKAQVAVLMESGAIKRIDIVEHACGTGKPAEKIVDAVVAGQSLAVDSITGSTYSSKVILKAIETALSQAPK